MIMVRSIIVLLISFGIFLPCGGAAQSLREKFATMEHVDSVWAVDKYHTVIQPKYNIGGIRTDEFAIEFFNVLKTFGTVETLISIRDPLTEVNTVKWAPIELIPGKDSFQHPTTKANRAFLYDPKENFRVDNLLIIDKYFTRNSATGDEEALIKKIVVTHNDSQPMVYRSEVLSNIDLSIPPEGRFNKKPFLRGIRKGIEYGDIMQYMVLVADKWGHGAWIIEQPGGFQEVSTYDMLNYLTTTDTERMNFLFYCDNPKPFVLKAKNNDFQIYHRTIEGIAYKPLNSSGGVAAQAPAATSASLTDRMAMDAINGKSDFESGVTPSEMYKVLYHGAINGCEAATVQHYFTTGGSANPAPVETSDYIYCDGQLRKLPIEFVSALPSQVNQLVPQVSNKAQQEGQARASYMNYAVIGKALRDRKECRVQVRIYKGQKFVEERITNGCR